MIGSAVWAVFFAVFAGFSLFELSRPGTRTQSYLADAEAHGAHVVMNGAMAAMFAPFYGMAAERIVFWVLVLATLVLAYRLIRAIRAGQEYRVGSAIYHLLATGAMIYAIVLMPAGMAPMHGSMHGSMHSMPTPWPATVLGCLFVLDAAATAILVLFFPSRALAAEQAASDPQNRRGIAALRRAALPHVVMDAGMAAMLL